MINVPKDIWLHIGESTPTDADFKLLGDVTWCGVKVESNAIHYVNADEVVDVIKGVFNEIGIPPMLLYNVIKKIRGGDE